MTTFSFTPSILAATCESLVSASFALVQAQDKRETALYSLAGLLKDALAVANTFDAWEAVRKPVQVELVKKYEARRVSKETATNNADAVWSDIVAYLNLEKPVSAKPEAERQRKHEAAKKAQKEELAKLAAGKSPEELYKMAGEALTTGNTAQSDALGKAASLAIETFRKDAEKAARGIATEAKKDVAKVLATLGTGKAESEHTRQICAAMLAAASHPDITGSVMACADSIIAAQIAIGGKESPASVLMVLQSALAALDAQIAKKPTRRAA